MLGAVWRDSVIFQLSFGLSVSGNLNSRHPIVSAFTAPSFLSMQLKTICMQKAARGPRKFIPMNLPLVRSSLGA